MSIREKLFQRWCDLSITAKFNTAFGGLLTLIVVVAATGYISLTYVRNATKADILSSTKIQQVVLEIDRGVQKSRLYYHDFFLLYPKIGFVEARRLYMDQCVKKIGEVVSLSTELKQLIGESQVSESLQRSDVNVNLFLASASRFADTFSETVNLVNRLAMPGSGLHDRLASDSVKFRKIIESAEEPLLLLLYHEMLLFEKEYRVTQQRPFMQSAFNVALQLRGAITHAPELLSKQGDEALALLDDYVSTAEKILKADVAIQNKFNDFTLQAESVEPITQELIALAKVEVTNALKRIEQANGLVKLILSITALGGLLLTVAIAKLLSRSITQNVVSLTESASALQAGNREVVARVDAGDELGLLAASFNAMAARIHTLVANLERKVDERTAELSVSREHALKAQQAAEEANQFKSEFLARMSHEIRTPLNAITGLTNIVLKSELLPEQRVYLNKVQIAGNNLLGVINDILDFSKVEAGRLELNNTPFDLDQLLDQLMDVLSDQTAHKDLELILTVAPQVPRQLIGDAGRITQILTNLMANAIKFTEAGEIVVSVGLDDQQTEKVNQQTVLKFQISDTGIGISAEVLPSLFEAFTQVDTKLTRQHEGTGLGLAICHRLVELMGGRIWAESSEGKGSNFYFTVVVESQEEEKQLPSLPPDLHGIKVLVVDDSSVSRQVLCELLESFEFNVSAANSGEKAVEELRKARQVQPFQLVLLDWKMSGMDGIETAQSIRELELQDADSPEKKPKTIIILVTAYGRELIRKQMDTASVDTLLLKPVKASLLFNTIMELFGRGEAKVVRSAAKRAADFDHLVGHRVLLVEDSELNRDVALAILKDAGLVVESAENGQIAVDKIAKAPWGFYNVVLMDIQMPVMDGYQATRKIRELERARETNVEEPVKIPIIALTAHALKGEEEKCLAVDMDDYLTKPLDEQDLLRILLKWISPNTPEEKL